jgi:hypothetical protein
MPDSIQKLRQQFIAYRRQLAELEKKRAQHGQGTPPEIWQEFVTLCRHMEQTQEQLQQVRQTIVGEINESRSEIISTLKHYQLLREQMREMEKTFLVNIVRPGQQLKLAVHQNQYLQQEYQRMLNGVHDEKYPSQQKLEADIRQVLTYADVAFNPQEEKADEKLEETLHQEVDLFKKMDEAVVDDLLDAISMEELIKTFKRVVLPRVHPDTSDTPEEIFNTVYEVYEKKDALLMEAYIVEYQGEVETVSEGDPLECLDQALETQKSYLSLNQRLRERFDLLKKDLTQAELEDPAKLSANLQSRREEILERIRAEAEKILYWRDKIEGLLQVYRDWQAGKGS